MLDEGGAVRGRRPEGAEHAATRRLVVGVGNPLRGDDGAGPEVIARLRELAPAGVELALVAGQAVELLETWAGAETVVVVDAARSGAAAGTVHRFDAVRDRLPVAFEAPSTHGFGLAVAIELGRTLGRLPRRLEVFAVEGRDFTPGAGLSPEVGRAVGHLAARLAAPD